MQQSQRTLFQNFTSMKIKKKDGKKTFKQAVEETPDVARCFQVGNAGLGPYRNKIEVHDTRLLCGSIDIDACTTAKYPGEHRWDYAICYKSEVFFIEIHSAQTSEVSTVLNKFRWLKDWLHHKAPEINKLKATTKTPFYWVQSKNFQILKNSAQYRQAKLAGLMPVPKVVLN